MNVINDLHAIWIDKDACVALFGLLIATVVSILSALERSNRKALFTVLTLIGFGAGAYATWMQHNKAVKSDAAARKSASDLEAAQQKLHAIEGNTSAMKGTLKQLAVLNDLSNGSYHVLLSIDQDSCHPCDRIANIKRFKDDFRVVERGKAPEQSYRLVIGKSLTLAEAAIFQQFANANALANGPARMELDQLNDKDFDCRRAQRPPCPKAKKRGRG